MQFTQRTAAIALLLIANACFGENSLFGIQLSWQDNSNNEDGFAIERSSDGVVFTEIARVGSNVTNFEDEETSSIQKYHYRLRAFNQFGYSGYTNTAIAVFEEQSPAPIDSNESPPRSSWPGTHLASIAEAGSYTYDSESGLHSMEAIRTGEGDILDEIQYAYLPAEGDSQLVARVLELQANAPKSRAGIMLRKDLEHNSARASTSLTRDGYTRANWKMSKTSRTGWTVLEKIQNEDPFLKIRKSGDYCWIQSSKDGFEWSKTVKAEVQLGPDYLIGLYSSSTNNQRVMSALEVLESTHPLLPPSLSDYRGGRKHAAIGISATDTEGNFDRVTNLYDLKATGKGFELYRDQLHFTYWSGLDKCRIVAKLHAFNLDGGSARTGIMVRSSLAPDSSCAAFVVGGDGRIEVIYRRNSNRKVEYFSDGILPPGGYLALERVGGNIFFEWSADGVLWETVEGVAIELPQVHLVGLVLGSHKNTSSSLFEVTGLY